MCFSKISRSAPPAHASWPPASPAMISHRIAAWSSGSDWPGCPLDAEALQVAAQARQRPLVEKAGQIVGGVGEKLAPPQADEQVEVLAPDPLRVRPRRRLAERRMRHAERGCIAAHACQASEQLLIGAARQQRREQGVFLRARSIDLIDRGLAGLLVEEIGAQHRARHAGCRFDRKTRAPPGCGPSWTRRAARCRCGAPARSHRQRRG